MTDGQILLIDNFFNNVDEIRKYALCQEYFPPKGDNWVGYRTKKILFGDLFVDEIILEIAYNLGINPAKVSCYFHYTLSSSKHLNFDTDKFHSDGGLRAGVVYLTPNPPDNSGTTVFIDGVERKIENQYNRFLCYNSNLTHGPTDIFGETIENSRLTLTFFS